MEKREAVERRVDFSPDPSRMISWGGNTRSSEVWRNHDVHERDVIPDPPPVRRRVSRPSRFASAARLLLLFPFENSPPPSSFNNNISLFLLGMYRYDAFVASGNFQSLDRDRENTWRIFSFSSTSQNGACLVRNYRGISYVSYYFGSISLFRSFQKRFLCICEICWDTVNYRRSKRSNFSCIIRTLRDVI